jgi:hypothetical protein
VDSGTRWTIRTLIAIVGVIIAVLAWQFPKRTASPGPGTPPATGVAGPGGGVSAPTSSAPASTASPGTSTAATPPASFDENNILDMDEVCSYLGMSSNAWLPGQQAAGDLTGRVIYAPNAAYTWSCSQNGPILTRSQITQGCQIWYPGTTAYAQDANDAYSWICS